MKTAKRILAGILVSILSFSAAGCTGSPDSSQNAEQGSVAGDTSTGEKAPEGGEVTVSVFDRGTTGQTQVDNNYWTDWIKKGIKEDLGIDVTYVPIIRSEEVSKLNVLMASNSAPDISFTYTFDLVCRFMEQGGLTQLDDLVAEYGPNLNEVLGEEVLKYGRMYGDLYSIPARRNFISHTSHWIRKDWLDALGLEIPQTTEEWYETMVAFKEKNPGNVEGVIPIAVSSTANLGNMYNTFIDYDSMSEEDYYCMNEFMKPGAKEYYRYMNKLNSEGLLSPDFALQKDDKQRDADVMNGKAGFMSAPGVVDYPLRNQPGIVRNLWQNVPGSELVPCDPFTNDEGEHTKELYPLYGIFAFIPSYSEHAREAIQYLDWTTDYDVIKFLQFGEEGVQHTVNEEGVPILLDLDNERKQNSPSNSDYTITQNGVNLYGDEDLNRKAWILGFGEEYADLADEAYRIGLDDGMDPPYFDRPLEKSSKYTTALSDKAKILKNQVITCAPAEFDALYDQLYEDYMKNGGQEVYDEKVEVYNLMKSGK